MMERLINITDLLFVEKVLPDYVKLPAGSRGSHKLFCVYCNEIRTFKKDRYLGVFRCECSKISVRDFYIKRANKLRG